VEAQDDGMGQMTATGIVTVRLLDVNEAPVLLPTSRSVEENSAAGTAVGARIVATDPDFGQTLTYSITGGDGASVFSIEDGTGQLRVAQAVLDFETKSSYSVVVRATDNGQPTPLWTEAAVTVVILDVNEPPEMRSGTLSVPENSPVGTAVGRLNATDPDFGQSLSFRILGG
ncbi:MAG: cadherin repeat domain-containing protein, partial [Acidovorax sp.]|uniref:cadherin repeat domain-containing protein n=1 Tax=Acidovorax sp. TaxID=1872122 RepID=UPI00391A48A2